MAVLTVCFVERSVAKKLSNLPPGASQVFPLSRRSPRRAAGAGELTAGSLGERGNEKHGDAQYWDPLLGLHWTFTNKSVQSCLVLAGFLIKFRGEIPNSLAM